MSNRNATFAKRQREQNQKDKASQKAARREERRTTKEPRAPGEAGDDDIDPDLVGIVPGPQPRDEDEAPPEDLSVSLVPSRDQDSA